MASTGASARLRYPKHGVSTPPLPADNIALVSEGGLPVIFAFVAWLLRSA